MENNQTIKNDKVNLGKVKTSGQEKFIVPNVTSGIEKRVVTYYQPKGAIAEQYRTLRTNLQRLNKEHPVKVVAFTSAIHNEGKTTTAVNMAVAMTYEIHKKILLVDGDLRKGTTHVLLGLENTVGISEYLFSEISLASVIRKTPVQNLDVILSGHVPPNPSELLDSPKMKEFLSWAKENYDFVLLDTPPVIALTDAAVLGEHCDGIVVVVQAGRTKREVVKQTELLLTQGGCSILGYVLTNVEYYIPSYYYKYV